MDLAKTDAFERIIASGRKETDDFWRAGTNTYPYGIGDKTLERAFKLFFPAQKIPIP